MEATFSQRLHVFTWSHVDKYPRHLSNTSFRLPRDIKNGKQELRVFLSAELQSPKLWFRSRKATALEVSCSHKNSPVTTLHYGDLQAPVDEELILQNKSREVKPLLAERCIYLVGMMGSGKTTIGKILAEVLNYSFCDCDSLVEQDSGGTSVADIFKHYGESYFRDKESEVLRKVSLMHRLVVSTGGGTVMRPINWKYMHKGISVWLDVPIEALAQRIAAVGTKSRPLLHHESGDAYTKAFLRLSSLFEERGESYANASVRVSLENMAAKLGSEDVSDLSPMVIAIEALERIENFLKEESDRFPRL